MRSIKTVLEYAFQHCLDTIHVVFKYWPSDRPAEQNNQVLEDLTSSLNTFTLLLTLFDYVLSQVSWTIKLENIYKQEEAYTDCANK